MTAHGAAFTCNRCGGDVGNGGIDKCAVVSDLDLSEPGRILQLHFCRENGCAEILLSYDAIEKSKPKKPKK